jgi:hypothetical protein
LSLDYDTKFFELIKLRTNKFETYDSLFISLSGPTYEGQFLDIEEHEKNTLYRGKSPEFVEFIIVLADF